MAGPWEAYQKPDEESGPWSQFKEGPSTPAVVTPGDVEARRQQVQADAAAEGVNRVRPNLTFTGELGEGVGRIASGAMGAFNAPPDLSMLMSDPKAALANLLDDPRAQAAIGAAQVVASPFARLSNVASRAGEKVADVTGSDVLGGVTQALGDVLVPGSIRQAAGMVKPLVKGAKALKSTGRKVAEITEASTAAQKAAEAKGAVTRQTAREQAAATRAASEADISDYEKGLQRSTQNIEDIGREAKEALPSRDILDRAVGKELGEDVGGAFKNRYQEVLATKKADFTKRYEETLRDAKAFNVDPVAYKESVGEVLGEAGVSRPLATKAEGAASKAKSFLEADEEATAELEDNMRRVANAERQGLPEAKILRENLLGSTTVPENPTVYDLIVERKRLREGHRLATQQKDDNLARQFQKLESGLSADIEKALPGVSGNLDVVNAAYRSEFVPYFGKKSAVRAIADKEPAKIAAAVIQPNSAKTAAETIQRAVELMDDPALQARVARSHFGGLLDRAGTSDDFGKALKQEWNKYTNPRGDNNRVLRTAYGREYDSFNSLVNQFANAPKTSDIDALVAKMKGGAKGHTEARMRELTQGAALAEKEAGSIIKASRATEKSAVEAIKKQLERDIEKVAGKPGTVTKRLQSIGSGVIVSGALRGNAHTVTVGGALILGAGALAKLASTFKGRDLLKAIARGTPGTAQAAATARIASNLLRKDESEDE